MHTRRWHEWGAGLVLGALAACGGGGGGGGFWGAAPHTPQPPSTPVTATVQGRVIDAQTGRVLEGVEVQAGGRSLRTGAEGAFAFTLDAAMTPVTVVASKSGFRTQARPLPLLPGARTTQDLRVYPLQHEERFPAERGVMAWVGPGVVDIPRDAVIDGAGRPYAGEVRLRASFGNPASVEGNDSQPQPYAGMDGADRVALQTLGTIEFELLDPQGGLLGLRSPARLSYPGLSPIDRGAAQLPGWRYAASDWARVEFAERISDGSYLLQVKQPGMFQLAAPTAPPAGVSLRACVRFTQPELSHAGVAWVLTGPGYRRAALLPLASAHDFQIDGLPADQPLQITFLDAGQARSTALEVPALRAGAIHPLPCVTLVGSPTEVAVPTDVVAQPLLVPEAMKPPPTGDLLRVNSDRGSPAAGGLLCMRPRADGLIRFWGTLFVEGAPQPVDLLGRYHTGRYFKARDEGTASVSLELVGRSSSFWWAPHAGYWAWTRHGAPGQGGPLTGSFGSTDMLLPGDVTDCMQEPG